MKHLLFLVITFLFASCQQNKQGDTESLKIETASENPCIQCTQKIQAELAVCLQSAGSDQAKIEACKNKAAKDWTAQCSAICKPGVNNGNEAITSSGNERPLNIEIGEIRQAEKTDKPADKTIHMVGSIDGGIAIKETCTGSGHLRTITVNGVCYSQMCCGGQWMFFYQDRGGIRVWCTCSLGESWTVNCDGNNWIVSCR